MVNKSNPLSIAPLDVHKRIEQPRFAIEIGGRRLPSCNPILPQDEVETTDEVNRIEQDFCKLRKDLLNSLSSSIRSLQAIQNAITLRQAIDGYSAQLTSINLAAKHWNDLVSRLTKIQGMSVGNISSSASKLQAEREMTAWQSELLPNSLFKSSSPESILTAKLTSLPLAEVKSTLEGDIQSRIVNSCNSILEQLVHLVDQQVLGFIEWYGAEACTYQRFTRRFEVEQSGAAMTNWKHEVVDRRILERTTARSAGVTKRFLCRHIQHLVQAKSKTLADSDVVVPREQQSLIESLPNWLSPLVHIVEGALIRETVVEQDLGVREWEIAKDTVQWHNDPAIVLGPFVLSAWGPRETAQELQQRRCEDEKQALTRSRQRSDGDSVWLLQATGMLTLGFAILFLSIPRGGVLNSIFGMFLAAIAWLLLAFPDGLTANFRVHGLGSHRARVQISGYAIGLVLFAVFAAHSFFVGRWIEMIGNIAFGVLSAKFYADAAFFGTGFQQTAESEAQSSSTKFSGETEL